MDNEDHINLMDINYLLDPPDNHLVNLITITKRCHGLVTYIRNSPQFSETFRNTVHLLCGLEDATPPTGSQSLEVVACNQLTSDPPTSAVAK